jgi:AraC-like DNA-binding protein
MSRFSQYGDGAVLVAAFHATGGHYDQHRHQEHQLAWAATGVLTVSAHESTWVLPPTRALWIPAGTPHVTDADRHTTLHSIYFGASRGAVADEPEPMAISGLARELMLHLGRTGLDPAARGRAEDVLLDQLTPVPATTITVPMPRDPRALDVARAMIENPADDATLEVWARRTGAGARTLARLFATETGMPFGRWRTHVRLRAALPLLADGLPVATAARRVGYTTPSAFVATFRKVVGITPGAYFTGR